jgi:outer membrane protein OmpA-like peptidoglycan-associated protein
MMRGATVVCLLVLTLSPLFAQRDGASEITPAAADSDSVVVERPLTKYGVLRTHLPDSDGANQVAVSHGRYIANFGSRDGVKAGAMFQAYKAGTFVGILRVEQVYRDTSSLRLVTLERKLDPSAAEAIQRGYLLFPHHVLLETVNFGSGTPDFSEDMHERLRYAARFILNFPDFPVIVQGHTDNMGEKARNIVLSQERADQVKQYLHDIQQIPSSQMYAMGYADEHPIANNGHEAGRFANRRVDIVMVHVLPPEVVTTLSENESSPKP